MSDPDGQTGRARGRARGRSRGATDQARRPGVEARPAEPVSAPSLPAASGGRKTHRGVSRQEQAVEVTGAMQAMSLSETAGRGLTRRVPEELNTRPPHLADKTGSSGQPISLIGNFFELVSKPTWCVYQYHVDFAPNVESSRMRRGMMADHKPLFTSYLFDGMSDLKSVTKLEQDVTEVYSIRRTDEEKIRISFRYVAELAPSHPELGRLFNTQMRRNLQHLQFQLLGRHYFDQNAISEVPKYNLQIWQGVITSIRQQEEKLMMSVDTVHKIVRKETAVEILRDVYQKTNQREACTRELVGAIVMTRYNNRTYKVEDINWEENPASTFATRDGRSISYVDYYKKQYDIEIRDRSQPMLQCTSKEREIRNQESTKKTVNLVPELCCMTGLTESMRSNMTMMRDLATQTRLTPDQRVQNLAVFMKRLKGNPNVVKEMGDWELGFAPEPVRFQGRVVPPEAICMGSNRLNYGQESGDFSREMRGHAMHVPKHLNNWLVITTTYDEGKCNDFLTNLRKVCPPMGMNLRPPNVIKIHNDRVATYLEALKDTLRADTDMVVFIVPNNKKERYDALKKFTCLDRPIPSQVIVSRTLSKKQMLMSVATKIGIQMACKLGGEPWALEIPFKKRLMIIGFDAYHDSSTRGRSAGAFVASMNGTFTRWFSKVKFHAAGAWQELSNQIGTCFVEALRKYQAINHAPPDIVLFYRDGVGDGQIRYVREWEVAQFIHIINTVLDGERTGTRHAFIIVNKRLNARFFAAKGNNVLNPPPGTVIDNTVTCHNRYDFFLVSQCVRQGTVGPTMYNIISDNSGIKPEHMQRLAYKLTHLYYNWPGTIRVPAPCQLAHKLAFLTGQSLHKEPRDELADLLYYL